MDIVFSRAINLGRCYIDHGQVVWLHTQQLVGMYVVKHLANLDAICSANQFFCYSNILQPMLGWPSM
jgi:hypothetical protein